MKRRSGRPCRASATTPACPSENSLAGSINQTYDLLTDSVLHVVGEQVVRVHHNLLVQPGVKLGEVKRVYSHPQALAQCQAFLVKHGLEAVTDFDTAGAAKLLAEEGGAGRAAIASRRAAEVYGLEILAESIEDKDFNYTRFFILGPDEAKKTGGKHKSSLVLATRHRPGDLVACLQELQGINMTKLESRPRRDKPWSYLFYIDLEGHIEDDAVQRAMTGLMRKAAFVKFWALTRLRRRWQRLGEAGSRKISNSASVAFMARLSEFLCLPSLALAQGGVCGRSGAVRAKHKGLSCVPN